MTSDSVSCFGKNDGSAIVAATGGTLTSLDYNYEWSNNETTAQINGLIAAKYYVTVTDENACSVVDSINVYEPAEFVIDSVVTTNVSCNGLSDGSIELFVTGGSVPYTYLWSDGKTSSLNAALNAGKYKVTISDAKMCAIVDSFNVSEPSALSLKYFDFSGNEIVMDTATVPVVTGPPYQIGASTTITVCFTGLHDFIEEIGFNLVSPLGDEITLLESPLKTTEPLTCNLGSNFTEVCFSSTAVCTFKCLFFSFGRPNSIW
ncbi:MAG: SprB repeat-containing protein [Bacteroidales bacterium]|nr:SprB repeat-containing protein [Bacteroidales bacterium]